MHLPAGVLCLFLLAGCVEQPPDSESDGGVLQEEAERLEESTSEAVEVIDDERSVERRIRDASIAAKVRSALVDEKDLRPFDFEPVVVNGRVLLRGEVKTRDQRSRAAAVASGVDGVRDVINDVSATDEPMLASESDASRDSLVARMEDAERPETTASALPDTATKAADVTSEEAGESAVYHTVRSGESLWDIARRNGVSVDDVKRLNGLQSNNIQPGQRLRVK